jgi:putative flippase GtrA
MRVALLEAPGIEGAPGAPPGERLALRTRVAIRARANWLQLLKFCVVGASGYVVNLVVYTLLVKTTGVGFVLAAVCSFPVAVTNNYFWNRVWTFRGARGHFGYQGLRFLVVSVLAVGANVCVLIALVALGTGKIPGQAMAIVIVTPLNFVGNKIWTFRK